MPINALRLDPRVMREDDRAGLGDAARRGRRSVAGGRPRAALFCLFFPVTGSGFERALVAGLRVDGVVFDFANLDPAAFAGVGPCL